MATCKLCGEPMPPGEEMFHYHGFSGPCPRPVANRQRPECVVEYFHRETSGEFWIDILVDRSGFTSLGPFSTENERRRAYDDLLQMTRTLGATDLPHLPQ